MSAGGGLSSFLLLFPTVAIIISAITSGWSVCNYAGVQSADGTTDVHIRLGLFRITQSNGTGITSFSWCEKVADPMFASSKQLCRLQTASQITSVSAAAVGVVAFTLCLLVSCRIIKEHYMTIFTYLSSFLLLLEALVGGASLVCWASFQQYFNKDLHRKYGIRVNLSRPFYIMLGAVIVSFAAFLVWVAMSCSRQKYPYDIKGKRKGLHRKSLIWTPEGSDGEKPQDLKAVISTY